MGDQQTPPERDAGGASNLMEDFLFIPISGTEAARGRGVSNTLVRARVTQIRHAQSASQRLSKNLQRWAIKPYAPPRSGSKDQRKTPTSGSEGATPDESEVEEISTFECTSTSVSVRSKKKRPAEQRLASTVPEDPTIRALAPEILIGRQDSDPFWTYPVDYEPSLSPIFAHYVNNIAHVNPTIDGPGQRDLLRRRWFPMAMTDPATMYAVLLMAAAHYCSIDPSYAKTIDLMSLKSRALSEINTALDEPSRATTDAMIGAVAKMASYEAIFGDSEVYAAHMRGLRQMLQIRGGLCQLGLDGMLERLLVWIDYNASHVTGLSRTFGNPDMPTVVELDGPDLLHFTGTS